MCNAHGWPAVHFDPFYHLTCEAAYKRSLGVLHTAALCACYTTTKGVSELPEDGWVQVPVEGHGCQLLV